MRLVMPNSTRINRGTHVIDDIAKACRTKEFTDLVILHEHRGQPDGMIISHFPHGPTAFVSLHNVSLRHDIPDIGTAPQAYPHLIFHNLTSNLGKRFTKILQALFPVPAEIQTASNKGIRTITFANEGDFVSFRHHLGVKTGKEEVQLTEVGPRFEMRLFEIRLGTAENKVADVEWRLTPYQRRGRKEILSAE
jgi:U3 small nucleolar ribonucleoprotein protein IMP4